MVILQRQGGGLGPFFFWLHVCTYLLGIACKLHSCPWGEGRGRREAIDPGAPQKKHRKATDFLNKAKQASEDPIPACFSTRTRQAVARLVRRATVWPPNRMTPLLLLGSRRALLYVPICTYSVILRRVAVHLPSRITADEHMYLCMYSVLRTELRTRDEATL